MSVEQAVTIGDSEGVLAHGSVLDIDRYPALFEKVNSYYREDPLQAEAVLLTVLAEDIRAILWEATKSPLPFTFYYHRQRQPDGSVRLVHQSDLHWGRDISLGVNKKFRGGKEYEAIERFKAVAESLSLGSSALIVSPKWDPSEARGSVPYTDSQLTFVQRVSNDLYFARQFQRAGLDRAGCIEIINYFTGRRQLEEEASIGQIVTSIGQSPASFSTGYLIGLLAQVTGQSPTAEEIGKFQSLEEQVRIRSEQKAWQFLGALRGGQAGKELAETLGRVLLDTAGEENLNQAISYQGGQASFAVNCLTISVGVNRRGWTRASLAQGEGEWKFCQGCAGFKLTVCGFCENCARKQPDLT